MQQGRVKCMRPKQCVLSPTPHIINACSGHHCALSCRVNFTHIVWVGMVHSLGHFYA